MATRTPEQEARWQQARQIVLARDNFSCVECGQKVEYTKDLHVHHIVPFDAGGPDEPYNLRTLCAGCHSLRHLNLHASLGRKWIEKWAISLATLVDKENQLPSAASLHAALAALGKK